MMLELAHDTGQTHGMHQAFILGAGLGTRLRPLTGRLPKPLVPLFHRPLAAWAVDSCARQGIRRFAINTHHLPNCWDSFGTPVTAEKSTSPPTGGNGQPARVLSRDDHEITLFHEPVLLETGGGLKNIASWIGNQPVLVHNGDIYSDLDLTKLTAAHEASGLPVTLALRSGGDARHIALDSGLTRVTDIRGMLGRASGTHLFTGIYCVNPDFLDLIPPAEKISIIPAFLKLAAQGRLGAVVIDDGVWLDLGDRAAYLQAHGDLALGPAVHPHAQIHPTATLARTVVGPGAVIGEGARLSGCVVWPQSIVAAGACLENCIVFSDQPAAGRHHGADL